MKIFALETDNEKAKKEILIDGEKEIFSTRYHCILFAGRSIAPLLFLLMILLVYAFPAYKFGTAFALHWAALSGFFMAALVITFLPVLKALVDWKYDGIILTDKRLIILNQSSIFKEDNRKMDLDNVASVRAITQFWNIFPFGKLQIDLKEGVGKSIELPYMPKAAAVAKSISEAVCNLQARSSNQNS